MGSVSHEDSFFCDVNGTNIIKIFFCFVINCSVSCIGKFATTENGLVKGWYNVDHVG